MLSRCAVILSGTVVVTAAAVGTLWCVTRSDRHDKFLAIECSSERGDEFDRRLSTYKRRLFAGLQQLRDERDDGRLTLVEIGCGGCQNFSYYPPGTRVICVDTNRHYEPFVREAERKWNNVSVVAFHVVSAENLSSVVEEGQADAAVVTEVLCSVTDVDKSLAQIKRILRPGGKLFFLEHVLSPHDPLIRFVQRLVRPIWKNVLNGCDCAAETEQRIGAAGFNLVDVEHFEAVELEQPTNVFPGARLFRSHILGTATKTLT